jgi:hypothetical protein
MNLRVANSDFGSMDWLKNDFFSKISDFLLEIMFFEGNSKIREKNWDSIACCLSGLGNDFWCCKQLSPRWNFEENYSFVGK